MIFFSKEKYLSSSKKIKCFHFGTLCAQNVLHAQSSARHTNIYFLVTYQIINYDSKYSS